MWKRRTGSGRALRYGTWQATERSLTRSADREPNPTLPASGIYWPHTGGFHGRTDFASGISDALDRNRFIGFGVYSRSCTRIRRGQAETRRQNQARPQLLFVQPAADGP